MPRGRRHSDVSPDLGRRIRRHRQALDLSQSALARRAGLNQGFLSEIEHGRRRPSEASLRALAAALGTHAGVLLGEGPDHDAPQPLDTREIPLLGSIPAGPPAQSQEQYDLFPVLRHLWAPDRYCLRLSLDSMEPTLKPGDIVLVHYRPGVDPAHVQGRICACLVDCEPTLKRVSVEQRDARRTVILRGDNPASPPLTIDESTRFEIAGVAICLVSRDL